MLVCVSKCAVAEGRCPFKRGLTPDSGVEWRRPPQPGLGSELVGVEKKKSIPSICCSVYLSNMTKAVFVSEPSQSGWTCCFRGSVKRKGTASGQPILTGRWTPTRTRTHNQLTLTVCFLFRGKLYETIVCHCARLCVTVTTAGCEMPTLTQRHTTCGEVGTVTERMRRAVCSLMHSGLNVDEPNIRWQKYAMRVIPAM